jgi:hypothetical protein
MRTPGIAGDRTGEGGGVRECGSSGIETTGAQADFAAAFLSLDFDPLLFELPLEDESPFVSDAYDELDELDVLDDSDDGFESLLAAAGSSRLGLLELERLSVL